MTNKMATLRRNSYTVEFKLSVIDWQRKNQASIHQTASEYSIDRKRVREWSQKYTLLRANAGGTKKKRRKINGGRPPASVDLDLKVFEFLEAERSEGRVVTNDMLQMRALQIAGGLQLDAFKASYGWLWRWKRRYGVGMRTGTNSAQKLPADYHDLLHIFRKSIIDVRKTMNIGPSGIVNMDQTMCRFDMPSTRTNSKRGEKTIRIKTTRAEKKGFTVALAATAAGDKLPAVIIFEERGGVLGKRVASKLSIPSNVRVRATSNGWMTQEEYHHWLLNIYGRKAQRRLLIVGSYKPHQTEESVTKAKERCNAEVIIIPGGCTSLVQPMDRCVNKPFKTHMRTSWREWMRQDRAKTKAGNLKQPTRQDAIDWVSKAWESITIATLVHSFKVCGISNKLDGTEDHLASDDLPSIEMDPENAGETQAGDEDEDEEAGDEED